MVCVSKSAGRKGAIAEAGAVPRGTGLGRQWITAGLSPRVPLTHGEELSHKRALRLNVKKGRRLTSTC